MSYLDQANLASDGEFNRRLGAALSNEARAKTTEELGRLVMNSPPQGVAAFMPFIASAPTFGDKFANGGSSSITDGDMLSAIQANWDLVAAVQFPVT